MYQPHYTTGGAQQIETPETGQQLVWSSWIAGRMSLKGRQGDAVDGVMMCCCCDFCCCDLSLFWTIRWMIDG